MENPQVIASPIAPAMGRGNPPKDAITMIPSEDPHDSGNGIKCPSQALRRCAIPPENV